MIIMKNMKVDRTTMRAHRAAILEQAGKLFRQRGIDGVAVADITGAAGLTHGAFYGHFPSKSALAAESCRHSLEAAAQGWRDRASAAKNAGTDPISALIDAYLSPARRDSRETSCMLACLGPEISRDPDMLPALAAGVTALTNVLQELIAERQPEATATAHAEAALAVLGVMAGGLNVARALADDPERSMSALKGAAALARRAAE
jgi:TetR/AcrR family transcriptional repressor of nem operon